MCLFFLLKEQGPIYVWQQVFYESQTPLTLLFN